MGLWLIATAQESLSHHVPGAQPQPCTQEAESGASRGKGEKGQALTLPQLQGRVHELHHILHVQEQFGDAAPHQHVHENRQEVVRPVRLSWEEEGQGSDDLGLFLENAVFI